MSALQLDLQEDEQLRIRVVAFLASRGVPSFRRLKVGVRGGKVALRGHVDSVYEKQVLLQAVRRVAGVRAIVDAIAIGPLPEEQAANKRRQAAEESDAALLDGKKIAGGGLLLAVVLAVLFFRYRAEDSVAHLPPKGQILFEGQATPGANIVLFPAGDAGPNAIRPVATAAADGSFQLSNYGKDQSVPPAEYKVTVVWRKPVVRRGEVEPGPNVLPPRYSRPETSPLRVQIAAGATDLAPLTITR